MSTNGQSVHTLAIVIGPEQPLRQRLYGAGFIKTTLKKKVFNFEPNLNARNNVVQKMNVRTQKMQKQMEEQWRTMQQEVIAYVVAQLQHAGLIYPKILTGLSVP